MGGVDAVVERAARDLEAGEYRWVAEVMNHVVFAAPERQDARNLQAAALEQLGYQAESGPWRNFYLTGAQELRAGSAGRLPGAGAGQRAIVQAMTVDMIFDLLGVRLDGPRADGVELAIEWRFIDTGEVWTLRVEHSALSYWPRQSQPSTPPSRWPAPRSTTCWSIRLRWLGESPRGEIVIEGDATRLATLFGLLEQPDPRVQHHRALTAHH